MSNLHVKDCLGSVRSVVDLSGGTVLEQNDYYAYGERVADSTMQTTSINRWRYNAKEEQDSIAGLPYLDYGARLYDPVIGRWLQQDPMAAKYPHLSPYNFCGDNPVNFVDPEGRKIRGVTVQDAQNFRDDIYHILADEKFSKIRALIDIKGKSFKYIDEDDLNKAKQGVNLSIDEDTYISMLVNAINSKSVFNVEYVQGDYTSTEGANAFIDYMDKIHGSGFGKKMVTAEGQLSTAWVRHYGEGMNIPTRSGSHSFIVYDLPSDDRSVISGHEVLGHGIPASNGSTQDVNNANAIRTDNLIRRLLRLIQRDGSDHAGFKEGQITDPYILPMIK